VTRKGQTEDPKVAALRETRSLNPRPEAVTAERFTSPDSAGFFDPRDLAQVKYEMVRAVRSEHMPVTAAAAGFGLSRQSYYQAAAALDRGGLPALAAAKPGPKGGHKLTDEVRAFAEEQLASRRSGAATQGPDRPDPGRFRRARAPPLDRTRAGPAPPAFQKPLTCPPPSPGRRRPGPCPCSLHLAPRLHNRVCARMLARLSPTAPGPTPATNNCATPSCTHARRRSRSAWPR